MEKLVPGAKKVRYSWCKETLGQFQVYKHSHLGVLAEEREQEIENLVEKMMTEKFPSAELLNRQKSLECRVPNKMIPKRLTPGHIIIKMQKVKDKES